MLGTSRATLRVCGRDLTVHHVSDPNDADAIRREIAGLALDDHPRPRLPGPNPVSIEKSDLRTIREREYVVCEKTDGVRFVAACLRYKQLNLMVLVDRAMNVYLFPLRKIPRASFQGTLIDGELAWDKIDKKFVFLAFDAVTISGVSVGHLGFYDRLTSLKKAFRVHAPHPDDPAVFRVKSFLPRYIGFMVKSHLETIADRFDIDGVILTPVDEEIRYGRHPRLFKLKTNHTVDFLSGQDGALLVYDPKSKTHVTVGQMIVDIQPPGTIVECSHMGGGDPDVKYWKLSEVRRDKKTANDVLTYSKTMLNMREKMTLEDVLD